MARSHADRSRSRRRDDLFDGPDEGPDEADLDRFGDDSTECPSCHQPLYDDASVCPRCLSAVSSQSAGPPFWLIIVLGLVLCALIAPYLLGFF